MNSMGQTNFLQALGWAVLNSLWQMALLWVIYLLITGINKTVKSSIKSSLASILLMSGFAWFIYTFFSVLTTNDSTAADFSGGWVASESNRQLNVWLEKTLPIASITYLLLLVFPLLHFTRNYRYVQAIRRFELSKADVKWRMFVNKVAAQMGIKKKVHVWISGLVSSPVTVGYLKPVILFPLAAVNGLSPAQLEAVLLHELSHIRQNDYLTNLIINAIQAILYFNPFVKAFVKTVEREREKSCDELVMQFQYDPHGYASALLILEKANRIPKAFAIAASGKKNDLLSRVEIIMGVDKKPVISFNKLAGLLAGLLAVIALNALVILNRPQHSRVVGNFDRLDSPFKFFTGGIKKTLHPSPKTAVISSLVKNDPAVVKTTAPVTIEPTPSVYNHAMPAAANSQANVKVFQKPVRPSEETFFQVSGLPGVVNASFQLASIPALRNYQDVQVKEAIDASKKVIENIQWKEIEKTIADVLSETQKNKIKSSVFKELEKIDWSQIEEHLRLSYNKIDWDKINEQLNKAIVTIHLDSLKQCYNERASDLAHVAEELKANDLTGIPDTDISLKDVEHNKVQIQKALNILKAIRTKKVVHL